MAWWSHYLHHRYEVLWAFHSVHHSQEQMNVLSDSRQHLIETVITATMVFVPARLLGLDAPAASALTFLSIYVGAFIHANIRTNLGPGRYVLVSPQAHRVHHSADSEHYDTNFGVILACWDYLFGTRYGDDDAYPTTGIKDRAFPLEHRVGPVALVGTWARQTAYPFQLLLAPPPGVERVDVPADL
jgi:sterol desaturase/sphingolipid hydroxylase (fatty acid hydroxylase superfamily)